MEDESTTAFAPPPSAEEEALALDWWNLLFGVRRSVRYHEHRRRFFDNLGHWKTWLALVFGSTAMGSLLAQGPATGGTCPAPWLSLWSTILVAAVSALDLVIGSTNRARVHTDLCRRFSALERTMLQIDQPTALDLRTSRDARMGLEEEEPPVLHTLDVLCHNEVVLALGLPHTACYHIPRWRRWAAPFVNVRSDDLRLVREHETA